jgi:hypothetical protein
MNTTIVQDLNIMKDNQDHFEVLRKIQKKPESTKGKLRGRSKL